MRATEPDLPAAESTAADGPVELGIPGLVGCREIGAGGFARVYVATEERFDRQVAVKVIDRIDARGKHRFEREQLTMGRMTAHSNVVVPYSSGYTSSGLPYLVMEYLPGGSLADRVDVAGPIDWEAAVDWLLPVADALGHGHQLGVVHRDVKPENILLTATGEAKLADFGIASIREASTTTQSIAFSLAHAPPETFQGGADLRDERSDLYSLASTLFTIVEGRAPFHRDDPADSQLAYIVRIADDPVPPLRRGPPELSHFLFRALAKNPADRPPSAADLIAELAAVRETVGDASPANDARSADVAERAARSGAERSQEVLSSGWASPASDLAVNAVIGAALTGALGFPFMSFFADLDLPRLVDGAALAIVAAGAPLGLLLAAHPRRPWRRWSGNIAQVAALATAALIAVAIVAAFTGSPLPLGTTTDPRTTVAVVAVAFAFATVVGVSIRLQDPPPGRRTTTNTAASAIGLLGGAAVPVALEGRYLEAVLPFGRDEGPAALQWQALDPFLESVRWTVGLALAAIVLVLATGHPARANARFSVHQDTRAGDDRPRPQRFADAAVAALNTFAPVAVVTSLPGLATPVAVPARFGLVVASFAIGMRAAWFVASLGRRWRPSTATALTQAVGAIVLIAYSYAVAPQPTDARAVLAFVLVCAGVAISGAGLTLAWTAPTGMVATRHLRSRAVATVATAGLVATFWHVVAANNTGGLVANNVAGVALFVALASLVVVAMAWVVSLASRTRRSAGLLRP